MNKRMIGFVVAAAISGLAAPLSASTATAAVPQVGFLARGFGSQIVLGGGVITSGPTALTSLACTNKTGLNQANHIAATTPPLLGTIGAVTTNAKTVGSSTNKYSYSTSSVAGVNLLGGLVKADALTTTSRALVNSSGAYSPLNTTSLVNLRIGGQAINPAVPANSRFDVGFPGQPAFATVHVNIQERRWLGNDYRVATTALIVSINSSNPLGLPIGSRIDISSSRAHLTKPISGLVQGHAFSTEATLLDGTVTSGRTALAYASCTGGTGQANLIGLALKDVLVSGTTQTNAKSSISSTARWVNTRNSIAAPNILAGLIKAQAIVADTTVAKSGSTAPRVLDRSEFLGLQVKGFPAITDNVKPNTVITLPQLGKVTFHKVSKSSSSIQVVMIEVVTNRILGTLPTGSIIRVGVSYTKVL